MKYRFTRDDGVELDLPGSIWEAALERAYWNGWRPSGTSAPWDMEARVRLRKRPGASAGHWPASDYFSTSSQHVHATDAHELSAALLRRDAPRDAGATAGNQADSAIRQVAAFARAGGFVIGRVPETKRVLEDR